LAVNGPLAIASNYDQNFKANEKTLYIYCKE